MAWSLITSVKAEGFGNGATTSGVDTTGADLIVLAITGVSTKVDIAAVSDSNSNTWTGLTASSANSGGAKTRLFYCLNPTVGSGHTFTLSTTGIYSGIIAQAFSGAANSSVFDQENSLVTASATSANTGSITPTENNEMIVFAGPGGNAASYLSSSSVGTVTQSTTGNSGQDYSVGAGYYVQTTAAAINPTLTANQSTPWAAVIASFKGAASGGATDLTPSLYSNSQTFHAPTVAAGAVTLTPALFASSQTFHAATVSQSGAPQSLTPSIYANSVTFYAATVSVGAVTLAPALVVNSQTFHAPTVSNGGVVLSPILFANSQTFHSASVSIEGGPQYLVPDLVANSSTFHAATVTRGAVTLTPALFANTATFHAATVTNGLTLSPPLVASVNQFFTAVVTTGGVTITPGLFANSATFYTATVANAGVQTLAPDLLTDDDTFYVPTLTGGARTIAAARSTGRNTATGGRVNLATNTRSN